MISRRDFILLAGGSVMFSLLPHPSVLHAQNRENEPDSFAQLGIWIHSRPQDRVADVAAVGFNSTRGFTAGDALLMDEEAAALGISHLGGIFVTPSDLILEEGMNTEIFELRRLGNTAMESIAVTIGNELQDIESTAQGSRFTPRVARHLQTLIAQYRQITQDEGFDLRFSYSVQGAQLDQDGKFLPETAAIIEACDVACINLYPLLDGEHWVGEPAITANRLLLTDATERRTRFERFEQTLDRVLTNTAALGRPLILSETGLPSTIDVTQDGNRFRPVHDLSAFADAYAQLFTALAQARAAHSDTFQGVYIYEWMDNYNHPAIWSIDSPIHVGFGLNEADGTPKFNITEMLNILHPSADA